MSLALGLALDLLLVLACLEPVVTEGETHSLLPFALGALALISLLASVRSFSPRGTRITAVRPVACFGLAALLFTSEEGPLSYSIALLLMLIGLYQLHRQKLALIAPSGFLQLSLPLCAAYAFLVHVSTALHERLQDSSLPLLSWLWTTAAVSALLSLLVPLLRSTPRPFARTSAGLAAIIAPIVVFFTCPRLDALGWAGGFPPLDLAVVAPFIASAIRSCAPSYSLHSRLAGAVTIAPFSLALLTLCHVAFLGLSTDCSRLVGSSNESLPPQIVPTLLTAEDPIFFHHRGIDFFRINSAIRSYLSDPLHGKGGSTITMQLAKVHYLSSERSLWRKYRQLVLSLLIEASLPKRDILTAYLATVPFGPGVTGLETASRFYFHRHVSELNFEQGLTLILSIYDPAHYNPSTVPRPPTIARRATIIRGRVARFRARLEEDFSRFEQSRVHEHVSPPQ